MLEINSNAQQVAAMWRSHTAELDTVISSALRAGMINFANEVRYPPPAPVESYTRTFTLARSLQLGGPGNLFQQSFRGPVASAKFGSHIEYAPRVIGSGEQGRAFKGRWWTLQGKMDKYEPKLLAHIGAAVYEFIKKLE